jgi:hypothetical protein
MRLVPVILSVMVVTLAACVGSLIHDAATYVPSCGWVETRGAGDGSVMLVDLSKATVIGEAVDKDKPITKIWTGSVNVAVAGRVDELTKDCRLGN